MFQDYFKKSVSAFVALTVCFTQCVSAATPSAISFSGTIEMQMIKENIPEDLGQVIETQLSQNGKTVVVIQDAHASIEAQESIRRLIHFLNRKYKIKSLILEGGADRLEPDLYRFFENAEQSHGAAEKLFSAGELTGAEMALLDDVIDRSCGYNCTEGWGAEAPENYLDNLKVFRQLLSRDELLKQFGEKLMLAFQKKASRGIAPDLLAYMKSMQRAQLDTAFFRHHLNVLQDTAQKTLSIDLANPRFQFEYPMLVRYARLQLVEKQIEPETAAAEGRKIVEWLRKEKLPDAVIKTIQNLNPDSHDIRRKLEGFIAAAEVKGFRFQDYPEWTKWIGSAGLMQEINPDDFLGEIEGLDWKIIARMIRSPEEKRLVKVYKKIFLFNKLLQANLTREEWNKLNARRNEIQPELLAPEAGLDADLSEIQKAFEKSIRFYEGAVAREEGFLKNVAARVKNRAILVVGGFHAEDVLKRLKAEGYGYASIRPRLAGLNLSEQKKTYRRVMLETSQIQQALRLSRSLLSAGNLSYRQAAVRNALAGMGPARTGTILDLKLEPPKKLRRAETRWAQASLDERITGYFHIKSQLLEAADSRNKERARELIREIEEVLGYLKSDLEDDVRLETNKPLVTIPQKLKGYQLEEAREIDKAIGRDFTDADKRLIDTILIEVAEELYGSREISADARKLYEELKTKVHPVSFQRMLNESDLESEDWDRIVSYEMTDGLRSLLSWGFFSPRKNEVAAQSGLDPLIMRSTIKHELVHKLSFDNVLMIPHESEIFTFAVDVIERVRHTPNGVQDLDQFAGEFGEPALRELYERGYEMGRAGDSGLRVMFAETREKASFFTIDWLLAEARAVYDRKGIPTQSLQNAYAAQRASAMLLAGALAGLDESGYGKPLAVLKQFFDVLSARMMPPDNQTILSVFNHVRAVADASVGHPVSFEPVEGLWQYSEQEGKFGRRDYLLKFSPTDLYPRPYDTNNGADGLQAAKERALGHLQLAIDKTWFPSYFGMELPEKISKHPAFDVFNQALTLPALIHWSLEKQAMEKGGLSEAGAYGLKLWLQRVFQDRYSSLDEAPFVAKALYASLPEHLQFLDSLMRYFVRGENDPRVMRGTAVEKALSETYGTLTGQNFEADDLGWGVIMLKNDQARTATGYRADVLKAIGEKIWPAYLKLYETAVRKEAERLAKLYEHQVEREKMIEDRERYMEELFNSLPPEIQQALMQQAMQNLAQQGQQMMSSGAQTPMPQPNMPSPQGQGQPGGPQDGKSQGQPGQGSAAGSGQSFQSGQGSRPSLMGGKPGLSPMQASGQMGSEDASGGNAAEQIKQLGEKLQNLEQQLQKLGQQIPTAAQQAAQTGDQAAKAGESKDGITSQTESENPGNQAGATAGGDAARPKSELEKQADQVGKEVRELLQGARGLKQTTGAAQAGIEGMKNQSWGSPEGQEAGDQAGQMDAKAAELKQKIEELNSKANELKDLAKQLTEAAGQSRPDPAHVNAKVKAVQDAAKDLSQGLGEAQGDVRGMKTAAHPLQEAVNALGKKAEQIQNMAAKAAEKAHQAMQSMPAKPEGEPADAGEKGQGSKAEGQDAITSADPSPAEFDPSASSTREEGLNLPLPDDVFGLDKMTASQKGVDKGKGKRQSPSDAALDIQPTDLGEKAIKLMYGLTPAENAEYEKWLDQKAGNKTVRQMIKKLVNQLQPLLVPEVTQQQVQGQRRGRIEAPVDLITKGKGRAVYEPVHPRPLIVSLLVDRSGSMGFEGSMQQARLTLLVLLEAIFEINKLRPANPVIFEVGAFENDPVNLASKKIMAKASKKREIIYRILQSMTAKGGTQYSKAMAAYLKHIQDMDEPLQNEKASRILMVFTDEQVEDTQLKSILSQYDQASKADRPVQVFVAPLGAAASRRAAVSRHGRFALNTADLEKTPEDAGGKILTALRAELREEETPGASRSEARKFQDTAYEDFKYETIHGKQYLVYLPETEDEKTFELGPGGPKVPEAVVPDLPYNSRMIYEIISRQYRALREGNDAGEFFQPAYEYRTLSEDSKWSLEAKAGDTFELAQTQTAAKSAVLFSRNEFAENSEGVWRNAQGLRWKEGQANQFEISLSNGNFEAVEGWFVKPHSRMMLREIDGKIAVFEIRGNEKQLTILEKTSKGWKKGPNLLLRELPPDLDKNRKILELTGETGLGKGTMVDAAAALLRMPILYLQSHVKITREDTTTRRDIGLTTPGRTEYSPSAVSRALEEGWWVVVDEAHKLSSGAKASFKDSIAAGTHEYPEADNTGFAIPQQKKNHPRARLLFTSNLGRAGIFSHGLNDDNAMQDREELLPFYWMPPQQEADMIKDYAAGEMTKLAKKGQGQPLTQSELNDLVKKTVEMAVDMRLTFAGFDNAQKSKIIKNWNWLTKEKPKNETGELLQRAPSPRVVKQIVMHAVRFPQDWRQRKAWVAERFFNFDAEEAEEKDLIFKEAAMAKKFGKRAPADEIPNLTEASFTVDGQDLIVQPVARNGSPDTNWDPVRIRLHPSAEILHGVIPEDFLRLLSIPENHRLIYAALQARALGRHVLFVGEQGGGKSAIAEGIAKLISGPKLELFGATEDTKPDDLTFAPELGEKAAFVSSFKEKILPLAMNDQGVGKTVVLGEFNQVGPETAAALNELVERGRLPHPVTGEPISIGEAFWIELTINPPNKHFHVHEFSDEFLERVVILRVDRLPPQSEAAWLEKTAASTDGLKRIHPKLLGKPHKNDASKFSGLVGVEQRLLAKTAADKELLPRVPGIRNWQNFNKNFLDDFFVKLKAQNTYFLDWYKSERGKPASENELLWQVFHGDMDEQMMADPEGTGNKKFGEIRRKMIADGLMIRPQDILWEFVQSAFTVKARNEEMKEEYYAEIKKAFEEEGLIVNDPVKDGLVEYLEGEMPVVGNLPLKQPARTGIEKIDLLLNNLQQDTQSQGAIQEKILRAADFANELLAKLENMKNDPAPAVPAGWTADLMELIFQLREMHEVLGVVFEYRGKGSRLPYTAENLGRISTLRKEIQKKMDADMQSPDFHPVFWKPKKKDGAITASPAEIKTYFSDPSIQEIIQAGESALTGIGRFYAILSSWFGNTAEDWGDEVRVSIETLDLELFGAMQNDADYKQALIQKAVAEIEGTVKRSESRRSDLKEIAQSVSQTAVLGGVAPVHLRGGVGMFARSEMRSSEVIRGEIVSLEARGAELEKRKGSVVKLKSPPLLAPIQKAIDANQQQIRLLEEELAEALAAEAARGGYDARAELAEVDQEIAAIKKKLESGDQRLETEKQTSSTRTVLKKWDGKPYGIDGTLAGMSVSSEGEVIVNDGMGGPFITLPVQAEKIYQAKYDRPAERFVFLVSEDVDISKLPSEIEASNNFRWKVRWVKPSQLFQSASGKFIVQSTHPAAPQIEFESESFISSELSKQLKKWDGRNKDLGNGFSLANVGTLSIPAIWSNAGGARYYLSVSTESILQVVPDGKDAGDINRFIVLFDPKLAPSITPKSVEAITAASGVLKIHVVWISKDDLTQSESGDWQYVFPQTAEEKILGGSPRIVKFESEEAAKQPEIKSLTTQIGDFQYEIAYLQDKSQVQIKRTNLKMPAIQIEPEIIEGVEDLLGIEWATQGDFTSFVLIGKTFLKIYRFNGFGSGLPGIFKLTVSQQQNPPNFAINESVSQIDLGLQLNEIQRYEAFDHKHPLRKDEVMGLKLFYTNGETKSFWVFHDQVTVAQEEKFGAVRAAASEGASVRQPLVEWDGSKQKLGSINGIDLFVYVSESGSIVLIDSAEDSEDLDPLQKENVIQINLYNDELYIVLKNGTPPNLSFITLLGQEIRIHYLIGSRVDARYPEKYPFLSFQSSEPLLTPGVNAVTKKIPLEWNHKDPVWIGSIPGEAFKEIYLEKADKGARIVLHNKAPNAAASVPQGFGMGLYWLPAEEVIQVQHDEAGPTLHVLLAGNEIDPPLKDQMTFDGQNVELLVRYVTLSDYAANPDQYPMFEFKESLADSQAGDPEEAGSTASGLRSPALENLLAYLYQRREKLLELIAIEDKLVPQSVIPAQAEIQTPAPGLRSPVTPAQLESLKNRGEKIRDWLNFSSWIYSGPMGAIVQKIVELIEEWLEIDQQITANTSEVNEQHLGGVSVAAPKMRVKRMDWSKADVKVDGTELLFSKNSSRTTVWSAFPNDAVIYSGSSVSDNAISLPSVELVLKAQDIYQIKVSGDNILFVVRPELGGQSVPYQIGGLSPLLITEEEALTNPQYAGMFILEKTPSHDSARYEVLKQDWNKEPSWKHGGSGLIRTSLDWHSGTSKFIFNGEFEWSSGGNDNEYFDFGTLISQGDVLAVGIFGTKVYFVIDDKVEKSKLPLAALKSKAGGAPEKGRHFEFEWVHQSEAESAEGYEKYHDIFKYPNPVAAKARIHVVPNQWTQASPVQQLTITEFAWANNQYEAILDKSFGEGLLLGKLFQTTKYSNPVGTVKLGERPEDFASFGYQVEGGRRFVLVVKDGVDIAALKQMNSNSNSVLYLTEQEASDRYEEFKNVLNYDDAVVFNPKTMIESLDPAEWNKTQASGQIDIVPNTASREPQITFKEQTGLLVFEQGSIVIRWVPESRSLYVAGPQGQVFLPALSALVSIKPDFSSEITTITFNKKYEEDIKNAFGSQLSLAAQGGNWGYQVEFVEMAPIAAADALNAQISPANTADLDEVKLQPRSLLELEKLFNSVVDTDAKIVKKGDEESLELRFAKLSGGQGELWATISAGVQPGAYKLIDAAGQKIIEGVRDFAVTKQDVDNFMGTSSLKTAYLLVVLDQGYPSVSNQQFGVFSVSSIADNELHSSEHKDKFNWATEKFVHLPFNVTAFFDSLGSWKRSFVQNTETRFTESGAPSITFNQSSKEWFYYSADFDSSGSERQFKGIKIHYDLGAGMIQITTDEGVSLGEPFPAEYLLDIHRDEANHQTVIVLDPKAPMDLLSAKMIGKSDLWGYRFEQGAPGIKNFDPQAYFGSLKEPDWMMDPSRQFQGYAIKQIAGESYPPHVTMQNTPTAKSLVVRNVDSAQSGIEIKIDLNSKSTRLTDLETAKSLELPVLDMVQGFTFDKAQRTLAVKLNSKYQAQVVSSVGKISSGATANAWGHQFEFAASSQMGNPLSLDQTLILDAQHVVGLEGENMVMYVKNMNSNLWERTSEIPGGTGKESILRIASHAMHGLSYVYVARAHRYEVFAVRQDTAGKDADVLEIVNEYSLYDTEWMDSRVLASNHNAIWFSKAKHSVNGKVFLHAMNYWLDGSSEQFLKMADVLEMRQELSASASLDVLDSYESPFKFLFIGDELGFDLFDIQGNEKNIIGTYKEMMTGEKGWFYKSARFVKLKNHDNAELKDYLMVIAHSKSDVSPKTKVIFFPAQDPAANGMKIRINEDSILNQELDGHLALLDAKWDGRDSSTVLMGDTGAKNNSVLYQLIRKEKIVEFVESAPAHLMKGVGVEALKTKRDEIGKKIDALKDQAASHNQKIVSQNQASSLWRIKRLVKKGDSQAQNSHPSDIAKVLIANYVHPSDSEAAGGYLLHFQSDQNSKLKMMGEIAGRPSQTYKLVEESLPVDAKKLIGVGYSKETSQLYIVFDDSVGEISAELIREIPGAKIVYLLESQALENREELEKAGVEFELAQAVPMKFKPRAAEDMAKLPAVQFPNLAVSIQSAGNIPNGKIILTDTTADPQSDKRDILKFFPPREEVNGELMYVESMKDWDDGHISVKKQVLDMAVTGHRVVNGVDQYAVTLIVGENGHPEVIDMDGSGKIYRLEAITVEEAEKRHAELAQYGFQFEPVETNPIKLIRRTETEILSAAAQAPLFKAFKVKTDGAAWEKGFYPESGGGRQYAAFYENPDDRGTFILQFDQAPNTGNSFDTRIEGVLDMALTQASVTMGQGTSYEAVVIVEDKSKVPAIQFQQGTFFSAIHFFTLEEAEKRHEVLARFGLQFEPVEPNQLPHPLLDQVLLGYSTLPWSDSVSPHPAAGVNTHIKALTKNEEKIQVDFREYGTGASNLEGSWFVQVDTAGGKEGFYAWYDSSRGFFVQGQQMVLGEVSPPRLLKIGKKVGWDEVQQQLVFTLPKVLESEFTKKIPVLNQPANGGLGWRIEFDEKLNPEGADLSKLTVAVDRSELRLLKDSPRSEHRLVISNAMRVVAADAMSGVFGMDVIRNAAVQAQLLLRQMNPVWFEGKAGRHLDIGNFLGEAALSMRLRIGRIYKELPGLESPETQFLAEYLAQNPQAQLVMTASVQEGDGKRFIAGLSRKVRSLRQNANLDIRWAADAAAVKSSLTMSEVEAGLLVSDLDHSAKLASHLLGVYNDQADPVKTAAGLAAGIKALSEPGSRRGVWRNLSQLLLDYLGFEAEIRSAFAHSA